jgi:uncharacterized protein (DUF2384 family)
MNPMPIPSQPSRGKPYGMPTTPSPMDEIRDLAFQVFGTIPAVDFWMKRPNPELGGQTPQDLIATGHANVVKEFLESLLEGDFG